MPKIAAQSTKAKPRAAKRTGRGAGSQFVYDALRYAIISLEIEPGSVLEETALCRQYKVSRTPVREGPISWFSSEGLVELAPNRGARVATLQLDRCRRSLRGDGDLPADHLPFRGGAVDPGGY